jgi:hypothetical protein
MEYTQDRINIRRALTPIWNEIGEGLVKVLSSFWVNQRILQIAETHSPSVSKPGKTRANAQRSSSADHSHEYTTFTMVSRYMATAGSNSSHFAPTNLSNMGDKTLIKGHLSY